MSARVDGTTTTGTFSLDGQTFEVENNVWVVGNETECVVIDAPHDVEAILEVVAGRDVRAILCTHAHDDHVRVAPDLADRTGAPIMLHEADMVLWELTHPDRKPDAWLQDRQELEVGGTVLRVIHTPGHAPGACCLHAPELGIVFTGDTLFAGGPGATGRSHSDFGTIIESLRARVLSLPPETEARPGHGASTTVGAEASSLDDWIARGY